MVQPEITVRYQGKELRVASGTTVAEVLRSVHGSLPSELLAALVNRRMVMLDFPLRGLEVSLEPVLLGSREGEAVARRSASLLLLEAVHVEFPTVRLVVGQSLGGGYFYRWLGEPKASPETVAAVGRRMQALCDEDRAIVRMVVTLENAEAIFRSAGETSKLELLRVYRSSTIPVVSCGEVVDVVHGPVAPSAGLVRGFSVVPYEDGLLLRFPRDGEPAPVLGPQPKLFAIYRETREWNEAIGVANVGALNRVCLRGEIAEVIRIAEGFQEKKLAAIADAIAARRGEARVVLVAGPSASGKTTFIKRLDIQLRVNGLRPIGLSLDNYFVDRERTPHGADGKPDYEALEALDLDLFNEHLLALLEGRAVEVPQYDFVRGRRAERERWSTLRLAADELVQIEGIHALNPRLTAAVPEAAKYRVFISALTQLTLDDHNRIFTSDARLLRRIVRDRLFRGHDTTHSLEMWGSVRKGEARGIFPFQEQADVMFNSALLYEPAVLRVYAERFLLEVPREHPTYTEAFRLLKFLQWFVPVFEHDVPSTSILREFIGGSAFRY
jgi:uridine kinase